PLNHDIQSGNNAIRLAVVLFPGLLIAGNPQVGNGKASQAGLGLSPPTSRPLVTNLSARAGSSTGERRNRGGMVMGFHLHQDMDGLTNTAVFASFRVGEETSGLGADDHRGVIPV